MKQRFSATLAVCFLVLLCTPAIAYQMPQPFSADFTSVSADGTANMKGKFYFAVPKLRMDMTSTAKGKAGSPLGTTMTMIVDGQAKTSYMLMPAAQMYMEFRTEGADPMAQRMVRFKDYKGEPCAGREDVTCKKVGTETVSGRSCDKWEITEKSGGKETMWVDQKLHFPIKTQTVNGMTMEFSNIKEGAQDPVLFTVPAGYRKFQGADLGQRPR